MAITTRKNKFSANYARVAQAIDYINTHFKQQPSLHEIACQVGLSDYHFQRLFTQWAGISPKSFIQYLSIEYAKQVLQSRGATLFDTALDTGLSGTSRLHDLFIKIEGMTPGEYKKGGEHLTISYQFTESPFGKLLIASTNKGICRMVFVEQSQQALAELESCFPNAQFRECQDKLQRDALSIFEKDWQQLDQIKLHLYGTPFQLKVWESLLKIPLGSLTTYSTLAQHIDNPKATRAVGSAIGRNPVAFLIPCHRVIQSTGKIGGYRWGGTRKSAMIGWEAARQASNTSD